MQRSLNFACPLYSDHQNTAIVEEAAKRRQALQEKEKSEKEDARYAKSKNNTQRKEKGCREAQTMLTR
jgi:hypothetical protein